jgi:outer membrane protein assembly factor BamB
VKYGKIFSSALLSGCSVVLWSSLLTAQVAVTTFQYDNSRAGANTHETILNPANVNVNQFGLKANFQVQGQVYAQPLYLPNLAIGNSVHNVVFVVTEHDQAYAFDVDSGQTLWHTNFLTSPRALLVINPVSSTDANCTDINPEIGITGTPVIDTTTNTMYLVAKTKETDLRTQVTTFYQTLHALDAKTGMERVAPRRITASAPGNGNGSVGGIITFDPLVEGQRPALALSNGRIYASMASHCDLGNYHGWFMAFSSGGLANTATYLDTPNGHDGGFWASGPAVDSDGIIFYATGNGDFNGDSGGPDFGDSVLRLSWSNSGFTLEDYFTPFNQDVLDTTDKDQGSGGVVLLPDQPGTTHPHMLLQVGKSGSIDLIDRDNMGHFNPVDDSQIVQTLPAAIGGLWGAPAFWNNNFYVAGNRDVLKAYAFDPVAQKLSTTPTSQATETFNHYGPTPSVSSDGTNNGIVWIIQSDRASQNSILRAYTATDLTNEIYNSTQNPTRDTPGLPIKFSVPTVADGHVFVGTQNSVAMYGLLP